MIRRILVAIVVGLVGSAALASLASAASPAWRVLGVTGPTNLPPVTSEVQQVAVDASTGTFTLAFEGQETAPIPFAAEAAGVKAALDSLFTIGGVGGEVRVGGGPGNPGAELPYQVSFVGALAGHDVPELTADASGLGGGSVTVFTPTEGSPVGRGELVIFASNVGAAATTMLPTPPILHIGPLPAGIVTAGPAHGTASSPNWTCTTATNEAACEFTASTAALTVGEPVAVPLRVEASNAASRSVVPVSISGGGASVADTYGVPITVSSQPAAAGIQAFWAGAFDEDGRPVTQAGGHPYSAATLFLRNTVLSAAGKVVPAGELREAKVGLPPGFLGDPLVTPRCPQDNLFPAEHPIASCLPAPGHAAIGTIQAVLTEFPPRSPGANPQPVYNGVPAAGYAAEFTGKIGPAPTPLLGSVRSDVDYGVTITAANVANTLKVYGSGVFLEGFPAEAAGRAFFRNPTSCAEAAPAASLEVSTWQQSSVFATASSPQPRVSGCRALTDAWVGDGPEPQREVPSFRFEPSSTRAASGTAATARLHIPQDRLTDAAKFAASDLKKTVVTLPQGLVLNPSAANGLEACSEAQIGFKGAGFPMPNPIRFDESSSACPDGSKLGTVQIKTPLLEEGLEGTIYLAAQEENPFHSLIALYLVIESKRFGLTLKLPGEVKPDPITGRLTATFNNNPQLPFEDLTLHFRGGGPRSELATPALCGSYRTTGSLTPWSAESESPAEAAQIREEGFQVTSGPGGGACVTNEANLPFSPSFEAGTTSTQAGAYAPLVIKLARNDGEQALTRLDFTLPPGLTGKLADIPYCSEQAIAVAGGKSGKAERASASCPAASELGTVDTAAGIGSEPIHVGGHVYLAGPYGGAPISSVVITPAVAGPFDLGNVVVRAPLFINPETAQITARSDEIPHILRGIPLQLRSVEIKVSRQGFTLNPTNCETMAVSSKLSGLNGGTASPSSRFQVGGCRNLSFKPRLSLKVFGKTNRNAKPRFRAVLRARPGEANIKRAQVNLPHSEFLEQNHIKKVCTRVQFAAGNGNGSACPKGSIYGRAKAWTPLLANPLEGFVYLRSNGGERELPDLVAALNGQIQIALWGKVDSGKNKGIRNTFEVVPDAPVSRFKLEMFGGKKGLLVNSENLCSKKAKTRAIVRLVGQNGKVRHWKPKVANQCRKHRRKHKSHKKHARAKGQTHQGHSRHR